MVLFTALIAITVPAQMEQIPVPEQHNWCNITYVTRDHCPTCVEQLDIIKQTNISCDIQVITENDTTHKYYIVDKDAPFWVMNGKKVNTIFTKDEIHEMINK